MTIDPDDLSDQQDGKRQPPDRYETVRHAVAAVFAWFCKRTPDEHAACDLTQDTWMRFRAWQGDDHDRMPDNLTAFLINQAEWVRRSYFKKLYKSHNRELSCGDVISDLAALEDAKLLRSASLPPALDQVITSIDLNRALTKLTDKKRRALMLRFLDDRAPEEIAGVLGVSASRVNQMIKESIMVLANSRLLAGYRTHEGGHQ